MQYICYENCTGPDTVRREIRRLSDEGFLSEEQAAMVDCNQILQFFETEIGRKLSAGIPCLREFKFSVLDNGSNYGTGLEQEKVLLQGVVDCALIEDDGITILDFKTDYVTEETVSGKVQYYFSQIQTYAEALSRIYEMPVKSKYLYFFHLDRLVEL